MSAPRRGPSLLLFAELSLVAVHLVVVAGFGRVYDSTSFFVPLAAVVAGSHMVAALTRRWHVPAILLVPVALGSTVLFASWAFLGSSTTFGIPTPTTWRAASDALTVARTAFRDVLAPTPALTGFQIIAAIALCAAVWFSDWAAFRLRATAEAIAPAAVIFVFCTMLGSGQHRLLSAAGLAIAALLFVTTHRAWRAEVDQAWLSTAPTVGPRAVLRAGIALAAVAVLAGTLIGPHLPGADDEPLVTWRKEATDAKDRTTLSPILDLQTRLVSQSDDAFFRVTADQRSYWRITGLDTFDGRLWQIDKNFTSAKGQLSSENPATITGQTLHQSFQIQSMNDLWVPAAFEPRAVMNASVPLNWDVESSTLIVSRDVEGSANISYEVDSVLPSVDPETLRASTSNATDPEPMLRFIELPDSFPSQVIDRAREVTAGADSRYDAMRALQDWFRFGGGFEYSTDPDRVPPGHSGDALVRFLDERVGYCEQFAGAFAAMARSLGVPARVAIGFTYGEQVPDEPGVYQVRGRHAHAWPEVYFPSVGWVPFEPTPGRGIPGAESYTGAPAAQDDTQSSAPTAPTTTAAGSTTPTTGRTQPTVSVVPTTAKPTLTPAATASTKDAPSSRPPFVLLAVLGLFAVWVAILIAVPAIRRRRRSGRPSQRVLAAWRDVTRSVRWATGATVAQAETHAEFAARVAPSLESAGPALIELADLVAGAAWGQQPVTVDDVRRSDALANEIQQRLTERSPAWKRARRRLSVREAFAV